MSPLSIEALLQEVVGHAFTSLSITEAPMSILKAFNQPPFTGARRPQRQLNKISPSMC